MKSILVNTSIDSYDVDTVMNYLATIGVEKNNVEEAMETIGHLLLGSDIAFQYRRRRCGQLRFITAIK